LAEPPYFDAAPDNLDQVVQKLLKSTFWCGSRPKKSLYGYGPQHRLNVLKICDTKSFISSNFGIGEFWVTHFWVIFWVANVIFWSELVFVSLWKKIYIVWYFKSASSNASQREITKYP
jgi:hypothetical protein